MRAGALNKVFEWLKEIKTKVDGEVVSTWESKPVKAYLFRNTGKKGIDNNEIFNFNYLTISIRNHINVDYGDRFKYKGFEYQIEHINPSNNNMWLEITIKKVNN